jgi:3-isopropylmalate/(R)-2-methylmalate dehydratase small subunit
VGLLPVTLPPDQVRRLMDAVTEDPTTQVTVDLQAKAVGAPGFDVAFDIDDFTRWRLLEGLDDIGLTLRHADDVENFEKTRPAWKPRTLPAAG